MIFYIMEFAEQKINFGTGYAFGEDKRTDMKVLILSCNTGEGHNSAARALKSHLLAQKIGCMVTDTLSLAGSSVSQNVSDLYLYSTRTNLFKYLYSIGSIVSDFLDKVKSPVYLWNRSYSDKLNNYIISNGFDAVICVHLFPAQAMSALKTSGKTDIPTIFVMTDYTCIPFLDETSLDGYVIPHEHLIEEFVSNGIPREKLYPFGIPIDSIFFDSVSRLEAKKKVAEDFGWSIPAWKNWFLLMTGSMGFGNTQEIIDETVRISPKGTEIIAVCGRNERMLKQLQEENIDTKSVHPIGYTDRIPLLMDACDVLFTKPGGISSTEAMSKHIPIIHTAPIPGCETRNAEFFHYHGMSYSCTDTKQQVRTALKLCEDMDYRTTMTGAQQQNARPDTCRNIESLITEQLIYNSSSS